MEPDRYEANKMFFIICIMALILSLTSLFIGLFILPFLIWHLNYDVPLFVSVLQQLFEDRGLSPFQASSLIFLSFLIPAILLGLISYAASNRIENQIYNITSVRSEQKEKVRKELSESARFGGKVLLAMLGLLLAIWLINYFFTSF